MLIIKKALFGGWTFSRGVDVAMALSLLNGIASAVFSVNTQAAVIEFFNPDLNNYFITAEPVEQDAVDAGAAGRWQRTGNAFATGGPNQVCRFYGSLSPGPNSHFYTAETAECAELKRQQAITPASQKRWNFESNDFLTTPAVSGACPATLVPVYRAYNNGFARGIDSNHRITSNRAAYLQTVAAGSIGEGIVMCAPAGPPPIATPVGVPTGGATSATIGAAGGSMSVPGGKLALTIPAGALAADTVISIQPFTNTAPGNSGAAYRLTPEGQTFLKPITLRFTYTDQDLLGTAADFLGAAYQTADGYWHWIGDPTVDTAAKTVSVGLDHFTVIAQVAEYQITPASKTVKPKGTVGLTVRKCYESLLSGLQGQAPTGSDCDSNPATQNDPTVSVSEWSVNSRPGGGDVFGRVAGSGARAIYTAPTTVPIPNPVAVSARVHAPRSGPGERSSLVASTITIEEGTWSGPFVARRTFSSGGGTTTVTWEGTVKFVQDPFQPPGTYHATGSYTFNLNGSTDICTLTGTLSSAFDEPNTSTLRVDENGGFSGEMHPNSGTKITVTPACPGYPTLPPYQLDVDGEFSIPLQGAVSLEGNIGGSLGGPNGWSYQLSRDQ